ncbi:DUF1292 domain-containing protein [Paenibacillus paeoniae]|uniref:DUF1292 domain-containing protein n=1 Tax=Paenibacillus paeoniae TaxID=2292705 RepID=A0A371PJ82_9BACL|nr:DUF1292 domain-containing protein [Paenibacillus paeoniae]REK75985.1 DUF1292 domain-containing protein [Paenibacillus paeoniae]
MTDVSHNNPERLSRLKELFGTEVELVSEDGTAEFFYIKAEFKLGDVQYVALQSEAMRAEDEVELFRINLDSDEPHLETIEDDEEWESVSEAYDDLLFAGEERP